MSAAAKQSVLFEDYVSGRLSPAKHALLSEYLAHNPVAANDVGFEEAVAGDMLSRGAEAPMGPGFFDKVDGIISDLPTDSRADEHQDLVSQFEKVKWRTRLPGISTYDIMGGRKSNGDRLYLLKVRPGFTIWDHSHEGDEWVLVLKGEYTSNGERYAAGDLHLEDSATLHSLTAGEGEECICLVMTQGPVKMKSALGKLLSPLVGL